LQKAVSDGSTTVFEDSSTDFDNEISIVGLVPTEIRSIEY